MDRGLVERKGSRVRLKCKKNWSHRSRVEWWLPGAWRLGERSYWLKSSKFQFDKDLMNNTVIIVNDILESCQENRFYKFSPKI
jgi:hypothetical protein